MSSASAPPVKWHKGWVQDEFALFATRASRGVYDITGTGCRERYQSPIARSHYRVEIERESQRFPGKRCKTEAPQDELTRGRRCHLSGAAIVQPVPPIRILADELWRDIATIEHFPASLSFGGGAINQVNVHLFVETMPFGGVGNSGIGNYYGKYGFDSLTHAKSILISPADVGIDHLLPPYTAEKVQALNQWFEY